MLSIHFILSEPLFWHIRMVSQNEMSPIMKVQIQNFCKKSFLHILRWKKNFTHFILTRCSREPCADEFTFVGQICVTRSAWIQFRPIYMIKKYTSHFIVLCFAFSSSLSLRSFYIDFICLVNFDSFFILSQFSQWDFGIFLSNCEILVYWIRVDCACLLLHQFSLCS